MKELEDLYNRLHNVKEYDIYEYVKKLTYLLVKLPQEEKEEFIILNAIYIYKYNKKDFYIFINLLDLEEEYKKELIKIIESNINI